MEVASSLKCSYKQGHPGQHVSIILNRSRFFRGPKNLQNKIHENRGLKPRRILGQNYGPFTLKIIMRPATPLTDCSLI